jgi:hypothetical protein
MDTERIEADYVVVGAGAIGMAFADALLDACDATIAIVDRRHQPGGHWHDAYPFARLHGPASHYGVEGLPFGSERIDRHGWNAGHIELPGREAVLEHLDRAMRERLLPSGRVTWLPLHDWTPDGRAVSRVDGAVRRVAARRAVVDATIADTRVPATHGPPFEVAEGVACVPPGELVRLARPAGGFTVVGAGKTAMDTVVWLLSQGVDPDAITWIRPRDPWLLDRANHQTDAGSLARTVAGFAAELEIAAAARSVGDLFSRLEAAGRLRRIDPGVAPTTFRCALVSDAELAMLRRVRRVVRMGRVEAIRRDRIVLQRGSIPTSSDRIHVHCASDGLPRGAPRPVFEPGRIVPQYVRRCAPCFSAALVARVEATIADVAQKNALCGVVPVPSVPLDWLRIVVRDAENAARWHGTPSLRRWVAQARLNPTARLADPATLAADPQAAPALARYRAAVAPGIARLVALLEGERRTDAPAPEVIAR